ncbi:MAG: hypothetical protein U1E36_03070 [Rickettsiales bacterium]
MAVKSVYKNAPIVEALWDVQTLPNDKLPASIYKQYEGLYPDLFSSHPITETFFQIDLGKGKNKTPKSRRVGLRLDDPQKKQVVQVKEQGFTFSALSG